MLTLAFFKYDLHFCVEFGFYVCYNGEATDLLHVTGRVPGRRYIYNAYCNLHIMFFTFYLAATANYSDQESIIESQEDSI